MGKEIKLFEEGKVTMTSVEISKITGKEHRNVMRDIKVILDEISLLKNEQSSENLDITKSTYKNSRNQPQPMFILDKKSTVLLMSGYSVKLRLKLINRLEELEKEILRLKSNHVNIRLETKTSTKILNESIDKLRKESGKKHNNFAYSKYPKHIVKLVLGEYPKEFCERNNIKQGTYRDILPDNLLQQLDMMEKQAHCLINVYGEDKFIPIIRDELTNFYLTKIVKRFNINILA